MELNLHGIDFWGRLKHGIQRTMREKLVFTSPSGFDLSGILSVPDSRIPAPAAVLCHGFTTGKEGRTYVRLERILNAAGVAVLRFDFFGHGESAGDLADITVSEAVDDVLSALQVVQARGFAPLGLMGSSFGGLAAVLTAAGRSELACLALKSPVSDALGRLVAERDRQGLEEWRSRGFMTLTDDEGRSLRLNYAFYEDAGKAAGYDAAPRIFAPTLIVHGDSDETVPLAQSRRLVALLPRGRLEVIPGADHRYTREGDFEVMLERISRFLIRHLNRA